MKATNNARSTAVGTGSARKAASVNLVYKPATAFRVRAVVLASLFILFTVITAVVGQRTWIVGPLIGCSVFAVIGIFEAFAVSIEVRASDVAVRDLRGEKSFAYSAIEEVRLEGGQVFLKIHDSGWQRMPTWLPWKRAMSLRAQVAKRLKQQRG